jgi:hypothetical protein
MRSSHTITLFSDRPDLSQSASSYVVSILVHSAVLGLVFFGVIYNPELNHRVITARYEVRHLDLHTKEPRVSRTAGSSIEYPRPHPVELEPSTGGSPIAQRAALRLVTKALPGAQTLVQPDIRSQLKLTHEAPLPTVVIWTPEKSLAKVIVAPQPEEPKAADVHPSLDRPNEEINLADIGISATNLPSQSQKILAGTTSPVVVHGPELVQLAPSTEFNKSAQPTPASVLSLSDLRMTEGAVELPPVNETAPSTSPGTLASGLTEKPSQPGNGKPVGKAGGVGKGAVNSANKRETTSTDDKKSGVKVVTAQGAGTGTGPGNQPSTVRFTLSSNGQFGAVVVGASLEEKYPETAGLWSGRLTYTVYLHVGLAKSWILQYSLPRSADAAEAGNITRLEAPWPYNIVRPNIAPGDMNADALMIHGFVNQAGRFETLALVFPPDFPKTQFVLDALQQWQFRPARQNGQIAKVEVLLIIPEELE